MGAVTPPIASQQPYSYPISPIRPSISYPVFVPQTSASGMTFAVGNGSLLQPSRFDRHRSSLPIRPPQPGRPFPSQFVISTPNPFYPAALSSALSTYCTANQQNSDPMPSSNHPSIRFQQRSSHQPGAGLHVCPSSYVPPNVGSSHRNADG